MVLIGGNAHAPSLEAYHEVAFPPGTMRISLREENVADPSSFVAKVREAHVRLLTRISRISVSLPDSAGRVVLLDLETRFKGKEEGSDIIRWKLKKNLPFEMNEMHLDYQVIQERETGEVSTLVSLISRQTVNQYENLLAEAGLQPNRIDFTTFNICRYFQGRFEQMENAVVIIWQAGTLSIMVFYNGLLDFYRSKDLVDSSGEANRLYREIDSSIRFYKEKHPGYTLSDIFFVAPPQDASLLRGVISEASDLEPVLLDVGRVISRKGSHSTDAGTLQLLAASIGAATRNL